MLYKVSLKEERGELGGGRGTRILRKYEDLGQSSALLQHSLRTAPGSLHAVTSCSPTTPTHFSLPHCTSTSPKPSFLGPRPRPLPSPKSIILAALIAATR